MAKGTLHLNVEFSAVADEEGKFGRLAKLLGLADADHARGKCEHLWVACTRRGEAELPQWLVEQILGEHGPEALIESELAGWGGGRGDSKTRRMRIGGALKHCLWMVANQPEKTEQRRKGGKTRADTASRQLDGKFASAGALPPAQSSSSEISSASASDPEDQKRSLAGARAIPPGPDSAPAPTPVPGTVRPEEVGKLAHVTWTQVSDARMRLAEKLGLAGVIPLPTVHPGHQPAAFDELRERIREEGSAAARVCEHVVKALVEQADHQNSVEWLSEKAFLEGSWRMARGAVLGAPRVRVGPRSAPASDVRYGRVSPSPASEYPDGEIEIKS